MELKYDIGFKVEAMNLINTISVIIESYLLLANFRTFKSQ